MSDDFDDQSPRQPGNNSQGNQEPKDNQESQDKRKTIYFNRLTLYGQPVEGGKTPRLVVGLFDGNPRFVVRTGDPNDEKVNYGQIVSAVDAFTFQLVADLITQAVKADNGFREKVVNKSSWKNGEKLEQPAIVNSIIVGKDSEGCVYISLHEEGRPNIRFFFGPSQWHHLVKSDGSPVSKPEMSVMYASAYAKAITSVMACVIGYGSYVSTYTDHDGNYDGSKPVFSKGRYYNSSNDGQRPRYNNRNNYGNRGGYNNNRGYSNNGYNNRNGGYNNRNNGGYNNNNRGYNNSNRNQNYADQLDDDDIQL